MLSSMYADHTKPVLPACEHVVLVPSGGVTPAGYHCCKLGNLLQEQPLHTHLHTHRAKPTCNGGSLDMLLQSSSILQST